MIEDIFEFVMQYILMPFFLLIIIGFVFISVLGLFMIPSCIKEEKEQERQLEYCFKQEPRTKDCEYMIWKYEIKNKEPKNTTTVMPMPVIVRR